MSGDGGIATSVVAAATPLLLAATGELVAEKAGVLNLGVEGMMLVGAVSGFATAEVTGSALLGCAAAALAAALMAFLFGLLTLNLLANQVASGLALTLFGTGLSALVGTPFVGIARPALPRLQIPGLSHLPGVGALIFGEDGLVYLSLLVLGAVAWFLTRTQAGLVLRAVGDAQEAAHALGYRVIRVRHLATLFGGAMAGLAGADLSLSYSPMWAQDMTAGRGWIALALVVFASWRPVWLLAGAYLFGLIMYLSFSLQAQGVAVPSQLVSALPYLGTVFVLVLIGRDPRLTRRHAPACLGQSFAVTR